MPDMKSMSASLYGSRPSPGGVTCRPDEGALAQPAPKAATNRNAAVAGRETLLIHPPGEASYAIRPQVGTLKCGGQETSCVRPRSAILSPQKGRGASA